MQLQRHFLKSVLRGVNSALSWTKFNHGVIIEDATVYDRCRHDQSLLRGFDIQESAKKCKSIVSALIPLAVGLKQDLLGVANFILR